MSDIFIKTANTGSAGWRKASKIFVKTANPGSGSWRSAAAVWIKNQTQWLKVWPTSGIIASRVPHIGYNASDTYAGRMPNATYPVVRIGDSYFGNNAVWDLNGWNASSYTYKWRLYTEFDFEISTLRTGTTWSVVSPNSTGNGQDQLPYSIWTSTNSTAADTQYLVFEVTANNSSNSIYNGLSRSTKIKIVREQPVNLTASLSTNTPIAGTAITYSSTWEPGEAYKAENIYIQWYTNSTSTTVGGTYVGSGSSYTPDPITDLGKYIYVTEIRQNSGTDYDLGIATGVEVSRVTTSPVGASAPNAFTYSLTNISSVSTPPAPVQQRVSTTSNTVLVEMGSSFPSDTELYDLWSYGAGSSAGGTLANPVVQMVTTLNQYNSSGNFVTTGGSFDTILSLSSSAANSPISTFTKATGTSRSLQFNVSSTTGAKSWRVNYTISGSSSSNGTFVLNTNSMPATITPIFGASNPTVTITGVTAYSELNQLGAPKSGTPGSTTSLSSITKPTAFSTTSTSNYTYYQNLQATGSQRRVTLPAVFNSGTTIYVSTNGYINWGGSSLPESDRGISISIPALDNSGITIAPLNGDLRQGAVSASGTTSTGGLWVFADTTNYWVTWWGNYYSDAAQVARYQVKFYWGQSYADVYIVNNSLTSITPSTTAVQNNLNKYLDWSATTSQTSTLLSTASMNRVSTQDGVDDNRTAIVASVPAVIPTISIAANSGVSSTAGTINWTSTNQASFSSTGIFSATGTTATSITKDGLTASTTYTGSITVTSSTGNTASANYSLTTSPTPTWTITWDAAGGEAGTQFTTQNRGVAHTAPSPGARNGFDFVNYRYPASGGTDPVFVSSGGTYNPTGSVTFGAIWTTKTYAVSYNANLGTGAPSGQTKTHGVTLTLSSTSPTRAPVGNTSYTFNGWNTASDGTGTNYSAGGSYTANAAVTLYAKWTATTATTYTLSYSANGGSTTPTQQQGVQGASITLAANAGTQSGFTFGGWNIGGTTYTGGGSYTFGAANATATAIWTSNFVAPSSPAPTLQFSRKTTATTHLQWYCDYPSISGNGTITSMQYEIRTTAGGGTLLASGTRSYPGAGSYPYSAGGTIWAFRMGTTDGDISYSSSARYGRARVVMLGTNGTTYYGTWSAWL